jgi:hypothetical protein
MKHPKIMRASLRILATQVLILFTLDMLIITPSVNSSYVIFEDIGQMATSLNYALVKVTVNLTSITDQVNAYKVALKDLNATITPLLNDSSDGLTGKFYYEKNIRWLYNTTYHQTLKVILLHLYEAETIQSKIKSLQQILPQPMESDDHQIRERRSPIALGALGIFGGIALGIYGTYMGYHHEKQIKYLLSENNLQKQLNAKFIEVTQLHTKQITEITRNLDAISKFLSIQTALNPGLLDSRLNRLERQMYDRLDISTHAIQQAQQHRLAIDLLPSHQLQQLFEKLQKLALANNCQLLLEHPSDLFQIEVSYFSHKGNVHLLLHVPMVTPESTLRLFKLHPFPLPLYKNSEGPLLMPEVNNNVLGISTGSQRYSVQLSAIELLGCHQIAKIYLCEKSGVLKKKFQASCLGALYNQDLDAAKNLCTLRILTAQEMVRQLKNNWFAVFLPKQITVPLQCRNGTSRELMMPSGISSFHLSEGCTASFQEHLVTSDFSVQTPSDFIHYEWKWGSFDLIKDGLDQLTLLPELKTLADNGINYPTLDAVQEMYIQKRYTPGWWAHFVHFVGIATLALIIFTAMILLIVRFRHRLRRHPVTSPTPTSPLDEAIHEIELKSMAEQYQSLRRQRNERERLHPTVATFPDDERLYPIK